MPYVPPIIIDTPDLIGQQIQIEQQNQERQFQIEQMRQRAEEKRMAQAQSYINRSLGQADKGKLGKLTQPAYIEAAQNAYYLWQDAGTNYYENPNPKSRAALDDAANFFNQTVGTLLIYDQEEKELDAAYKSDPFAFRTPKEQFDGLANERRNLVSSLPVGAPIPTGISLSGYITRNDDVEPFSFNDEAFKIANRIQNKIDAEPNKYAPGGKLNMELLQPLIDEEIKYKLGSLESSQMPAITIAAINNDLDNPSLSEYQKRVSINPEFGARQEQAAFNKLSELAVSGLNLPKPKEATAADKEKRFPAKYSGLGEVPVTIEGQEGVQQIFSGNRVIKVALADQAPKNIVGRGRVNGVDYVLTIPSSQLEMWQEGYTENTSPTWEKATPGDKEAMKQNMVGYYSTGSFKTSATPPKKGVSSQGKKDPLGIL